MFYKGYSQYGNAINRIDTSSKFLDQSYVSNLSKTIIDIKPLYKEFSLQQSQNHNHNNNNRINNDQNMKERQNHSKFNLSNYCNVELESNEDQIAMKCLDNYLIGINQNNEMNNSLIAEQLDQLINMIIYLKEIILQFDNDQIAKFGGELSNSINSDPIDQSNSVTNSKRSLAEKYESNNQSLQSLRETKVDQEQYQYFQIPQTQPFLQLPIQQYESNPSQSQSLMTPQSRQTKAQSEQQNFINDSFSSDLRRQAEGLEDELGNYVNDQQYLQQQQLQN